MAGRKGIVDEITFRFAPLRMLSIRADRVSDMTGRLGDNLFVSVGIGGGGIGAGGGGGG